MHSSNPSTPAGLESFPNHAALGQRIGCSRQLVDRFVSRGLLRPADDGIFARLYATADLDKLRANMVAEVRDRCARLRLNESEVRDLLAGAADTLKLRPDRPFALQLRATSVSRSTGILAGVTVAKAGVKAVGKYVYADSQGNISNKLSLSHLRKLPVMTDATFLDTLLGAVQDAGGKLKVRSDHSDTIGSRAGYATNFSRQGDCVVCDLHLNQSYRDRDTVLETAQKTPELMGCSIDFSPEFVVSGNHALMRVRDISAVDIVDEGAVTPGGFFQ